MRVSLSQIRRPAPNDGTARDARPLLDAAGARIVLGSKMLSGSLIEPIVPAADTLFGPRGAHLAAMQGPLFVSDTGHHRLLIWNSTPELSHTPADLVIGQPDFSSEGRNAKAAVGPATLNVPTGVAAREGVLAVADAWNHRVLIWHGYPSRSNQPADVVLGQADFSCGLANRGSSTASAESLNWCYGVALSDGALYVADTGNRRVLRWNRVPQSSGFPADLVLGQADFASRDENAGHPANAMSMRWPHAVVSHRGMLAVADAGNNRIMIWSRTPEQNGTPCSFVLGQRACTGVDHNQAAYYPTAATLNMPYGLTVLDGCLVAADTANSRLVGYRADGLEMGSSAHRLAGQLTFVDKGDNRWGVQRRDSLCWPYGISASGSTLTIADSGNNRVLLWEAAA